MKMQIGFHGNIAAHSDAAIKHFLKSIQNPAYPAHPFFTRPAGVNPAPSSSQREYPHETVPCTTNRGLFQQLASGSLDLGLVPIENTFSGTFAPVFDQLLQFHGKVHVVGEWVCQQHNSLMVGPGSPLYSPVDGGKIDAQTPAQHLPDQVISHQHVLDQCQAYLESLNSRRVAAQLPALVVRAMDDTAVAAEWLQQHPQENAAVIGNIMAASVYGLQVVAPDVEDDRNAATRFLLLSGRPLTNEQLSACAQATTNKTTLAILLKNQPGMLFRSLGCFSFRDLNVTKMESRPSPRATAALATSQSIWEYINFVDVEGGMNEERVRNAISNLQEFATTVRVLGSYPRFSGVLAANGMSTLGGAFGM